MVKFYDGSSILAVVCPWMGKEGENVYVCTSQTIM